MKRLLLGTLFAGISLLTSGVTVDVVSGYAETKTVGDYAFLIVKSNSTLRVSGKPGTIDVLAVGGGGGGACGFGGGGGGGAVVERINISVTAGDYPVTVGAGGAKGYESYGFQEAEKGGTSSAFGVSALGGGAGGFWGWDTEHNVGATGGGAGAIGAGATYVSKDGLHHGGEEFAINGAPGTAGLGYGGGACTNTSHSWCGFGGGGGGAGGPGNNARGCSTFGGSDGWAGSGGIGVCSLFTGEPVWYGGGGGGGANRCVSRAAGGKGGGGRGSKDYGGTGEGGKGEAGQDFAGGGGGGGSRVNDSYYAGGQGGCGLVIVRYRREWMDPTSCCGSTTRWATNAR